MLARDQIELITETIPGAPGDKNEYGDPIINKTYVTVFADKLPINMNEKYQSNAQGLRPEYKFNVRFSEYGGQQRVRYPVTTGSEYDVIRTYTKDDEWIELTLQGVVAGGNA